MKSEFNMNVAVSLLLGDQIDGSERRNFMLRGGKIFFFF